jgi:hypothetical protein
MYWWRRPGPGNGSTGRVSNRTAIAASSPPASTARSKVAEGQPPAGSTVVSRDRHHSTHIWRDQHRTQRGPYPTGRRPPVVRPGSGGDCHGRSHGSGRATSAAATSKVRPLENRTLNMPAELRDTTTPAPPRDTLARKKPPSDVRATTRSPTSRSAGPPGPGITILHSASPNRDPATAHHAAAVATIFAQHATPPERAAAADLR